MKNKILITILIIIFVPLVLYLICCFSFLSWNPFLLMKQSTRTGISIVTIGLISIGILLNEK